MSGTEGFDNRDLFDFACGDLDPQRRAELEQRIREDSELAARVVFFRAFAPPDEPVSIWAAAASEARVLLPVALFAGAGSFALFCYVSRIGALVYFGAELLWTAIARYGFAQRRTGTLWESAGGAAYLGIVGLLPGFFAGKPLIASLGPIAVVLGLFGARIGFMRGFGLRAKYDGDLGVKVLRDSLILWLANLGGAGMVIGGGILIRIAAGSIDPRANEDAIAVQWIALLATLPAFARLFAASPIRCAFKEAVPAAVTGAALWTLPYLVLHVAFGIELLSIGLLTLAATGASLETRQVIYEGYTQWAEAKRLAVLGVVPGMVRVAMRLTSLGLAFGCGLGAATVITMLTRDTENDLLFEAVGFMLAYFGGLVVTMRAMDRVWNRYFGPALSDFGRRSEGQLKELLSYLGSEANTAIYGVLGVARDVAGFYVSLVESQVAMFALGRPN